MAQQIAVDKFYANVETISYLYSPYLLIADWNLLI